MGKWINLTAGFLIGGFARYFVSTWVYQVAGTEFPYGTLAVNVTGCFLVGLFDALAEGRFALGPEARLLLMTGFCGAYTTFSSLILESSHLVRDGQTARALTNFIASGIIGFILFRLGMAAGLAL